MYLRSMHSVLRRSLYAFNVMFCVILKALGTTWQSSIMPHFPKPLGVSFPFPSPLPSPVLTCPIALVQAAEDAIMAEMAEVKAGMERRQKREKRKKLEQKKKARVRAAQAVLGTSGITMHDGTHGHSVLLP